jgi:hypothetical protein
MDTQQRTSKMRTSKSLRLFGTLALLVSAAALPPAAQAQTTPPPSPSQAPPAAAPSATPSNPAARAPVATPRTSDKSASQSPKVDPLIGLTTFSSDGTKVGTISGVARGPDGKITAIRFKTGGFLGFGGKVVEVPDGKFARTGDTVRLGLSAEEVSKLPEAKTQG